MFLNRMSLKFLFLTKRIDSFVIPSVVGFWVFFFLENPWSLWIWTSDIKNAGTDATIFFQIYGDKGKSDEMKLDNNSDNFEAGQTDKFMVWITA